MLIAINNIQPFSGIILYQNIEQFHKQAKC